ncbi:hypothetical protein ABZ446_43795 [Streptomyces sp. NPDC005813]|uniref:hypothetical protein n=1 Tax=Streptomyces sp. NPDC005813 TaxID=3155592 RepID=UPI0033C07E42
MSVGLAVGVALPAIGIAPLLTLRLTEASEALDHVRLVEGEAAYRLMLGLAALYARFVQASGRSDRYEVRRAAEISHHLLWDVAPLLQAGGTRSLSSVLIAREMLMLRFVDQVATLRCAPGQSG